MSSKYDCAFDDLDLDANFLRLNGSFFVAGTALERGIISVLHDMMRRSFVSGTLSHQPLLLSLSLVEQRLNRG